MSVFAGFPWGEIHNKTMDNEKKVIRGIVLRAVDTKEADKILTVLAGEQGKLSVVAKGARSRRSRVTAATQFLAYSEMTVTECHGWQILSEANTMELFDGIRKDIEALSLASYFAELVDAVTYADIPAQEVLSLLLNALYALGTLHKEQKQVKAAFELRLLTLAGFEPFLERCAVCGQAEPEPPMLDVVQGVLHCGNCVLPGRRGLSMPLCAASLGAMRYVVTCPPKKLYAFSLPEEAQRRMADAAEAFSAAQLERGFHTLDFYKTLCRKEGASWQTGKSEGL